LSLISGWYSGRLLDRSVTEELAAIEAYSALLVAMGCVVLVYAETSGSIAGDRRRPLSSRPRLDDADWCDFGSRLTELAERLSRCGIRLAYHHHMGTVVEREAEIDRLLAVTGDDVGLLLDTGHLAFAGADPAAIARRYGHRISMSTARMYGEASLLARAPAMRAFSRRSRRHLNRAGRRQH
jgi:inosose dehydratase